MHSEGRVDPTPMAPLANRWHAAPGTEFKSQGFKFLISLEFGEVDRYSGVSRVYIVGIGNLGGFVMLLNGLV